MTEIPGWNDLETQISRVTEEVEALRKQNRKLSSRMKRRQREPPGLAADAAAGKAWESEKRRLRGLVEGLVKTLERLL